MSVSLLHTAFHLGLPAAFQSILKYVFFRDPVFGGSPYPLQYGGCAVPGLQVRLPLDSLVQGENISSQLGEKISDYDVYNENISGEDISDFWEDNSSF